MKKTSIAVAVLCATTVAFGQGSLTPPGAPGATMKTLNELDNSIAGVSNAVEQVEARIDLATVAAGSGYKHLILESGSYYLSNHIAVSETSGIYIGAPDVSIDLNGFKIYRTSGSGGYGIYIASGKNRATIKNGSIQGFSSGLYAISGYPNYVYGCHFEKLSVSGCSDYGIHASSSSLILNCCSHDNLGQGFFASRNSIIKQCISRNDGGFAGIYASENSRIENCTVIAHKGTGDSNSGIYASQGSSVQNCQVRYSSSTNSSASAGIGIYVYSGSMVEGCVVELNKSDGIAAAAGNCVIENNRCVHNGLNGDGAGIHIFPNSYYNTGGNRIMNNNVTQNDWGIDVESIGNFIAKNTAHANNDNYAIVSGNDTGTIQTSPIGADAWDNFSF